DRIQLTRLQIDEQIRAIRKKIEALQIAKARFIAEQQNADRTFVPVVHPGSNGTVRRPIYIECTAESVILQPEKIVLPPHVLEPDGTGENLLARAVRTLGGYYAAHNAANEQPTDRSDAQPYPLLVVR